MLVLGALLLSACGGQQVTHNWPGLAADNERAYIATGSFIHAVDLKTGLEVWKYPPEADSKQIYFATPVLTEDGQLLIGSEGNSHIFISLDTATGKENWAQPFSEAKGPWVAAPLVLNNTIYAPNTDGSVYVLDMNGAQTADPIEVSGKLWSPPATDGKLLYIASLDHHFHIIDPATGKGVHQPIDLGGAAPSKPAIGPQGAYIGSFANKIEFIQPDGKHDTIAKTNNWVWGSPVLDGQTLYYADLDGYIYSYNVTEKTQNWVNVKPDGAVVASLLIVEDHIFAATEAGTIFALDRDGKIIWEKQPGGQIYTTPVYANDLILVAPYQADFMLAAYDIDGKQAWTFTPGK